MSIEPKFSIKVNSKDREILMSYGLLNALTSLCQDPTEASMIQLDPELRNKVLAATLAERKPSGKVTKEFDAEDIDAELEKIEDLLAWVQDHLIAFFLRSTQRTLANQKKYEKDFRELAPQSSSDGSPA
ncbi:hypothetical protein IZ6_25140 [Terrihabitans soli]|uniref:Uncharacterized protein n=1 Tax=Terrihabitans soli TaxID=708113 RepID=A0A6S6QRU4_9HYPH|nr:hypothetical protein [Terrihabitans soli]BCJ91779.1 hypothetical protein IZ6_25140 [Terrihabitans soli]